MLSNPRRTPRLLSITLAVGLYSAIGHGAEAIRPADMLEWERRDFANSTEYRQVMHTDQMMLEAQCSDSASALYLEKTIDLRDTPVLEWSWAVAGVFEGIDETQKSGDDYPVRLYVVKDGGLLPWRTRAVNYVWSSSQPVGEVWSNAYASQAQMLALRSGVPESRSTAPVSERRNVREDFQQLHGVELDSIDGLAIMTDCDNSGQPATGWYGEIRWLPADN